MQAVTQAEDVDQAWYFSRSSSPDFRQYDAASAASVMYTQNFSSSKPKKAIQERDVDEVRPMVFFSAEFPHEDVCDGSLAGVSVPVNPKPEWRVLEVGVYGRNGLAVGTVNVGCLQGPRAWKLEGAMFLEEGLQTLVSRAC